MEMAWATLPIPLTASSSTFRPQASPCSFYRYSTLYPGLSSKFTDRHLSVKLQKFSFAAVASGTTAVSADGIKEKLSFSDTSEPATYDNDPTINGENGGQNDGADDGSMVQVCDKLIVVFMVDKPTPADWRRLLAFSREWENIRPHFFKRLQDRADNEDDPGMKHKLLKFSRKLKEIDEDIQRHNELIEVIKKAPSKISEIVASSHKNFTKEFFVHLYTVAQSYHDNPNEQNALEKLGNECVAAVQAYDYATESVESLRAVELKFQDIVNSPSLDGACRKIDDLAVKNQLDSAVVMMITKAWSAAKESNLTKDEVKDVLYHLYKTAVGNLERQMPKEIRILKYLLSFEDPEERLCALKDAFTPGEEELEHRDCLYTTPEKLHTWITSVVDAYHFSQEGTLIREARDLMNPKVIRKLQELKKLIEGKFM